MDPIKDIATASRKLRSNGYKIFITIVAGRAKIKVGNFVGPEYSGPNDPLIK